MNCSLVTTNSIKFIPRSFIECQKEAERIALEAGKVVRETFSKDKHVAFKNGDTTDLVTETDQWVENFVREQLRLFKPDWSFIGEESSSSDVVIPAEPVWIIDPIDGTTNFVHRFPELGISIALVVNKEPVVGVILNPVTGQLLSAVKGQGALLNGRPHRLDPIPDRPLSQCLIMTHFSNRGNRSKRFEQIDHLLDVPVHAMRFIGCATMGFSYVATGVADVYFERGLKAWDMAAGVVIIKEAGGAVIDYTGSDTFDLSRREVISSRNMNLAKEILKIVHTNL